jgi:hypothetical protein
MVAFPGLGNVILPSMGDISPGRIFTLIFLGLSAAVIASVLISEEEQTSNKQEERFRAGLS